MVSYQLYPLLLYSESCIDDDPHKPGGDEGADLREKQAIWMLKENKSIEL